MGNRTKHNLSEIEIMAPSGSWESLQAARQARANSVYFGIEQFNMRAKSSVNFTLEELPEIVKFCQANGMKSYLTLNTILYDHDLGIMRRIIEQAKASGISAIIAADQAAIHYAWSLKVPVHISTQANVSNIESLKFYALFADVVVLARELSLRQVAAITRQIEQEQIKGPAGELVRVELFAHGALCMAVSGKCYLSLHEQNSSANRGACTQTCRKSYIVTDKETGRELEIDNENIMSPKDLSTIGFIDKILEAGVKVLKIEGRARPGEYVKTVVECYREAVEAVAEGTYGPAQIADWNARLATVFNRGFWDGYYLGRRLGEWAEGHGSKATERKIYVGKGLRHYSKLGVGEFVVETGNLAIGDKFLITGPTTGIMEGLVESLHLDKGPAAQVDKGDVFGMPVTDKIRPSDKLYKIVPAEEGQQA